MADNKDPSGGGGGSLSSSIGPSRSLVASSMLSHLLTGGFSAFGLSATTMPSDSDLLTRLLLLAPRRPLDLFN